MNQNHALPKRSLPSLDRSVPAPSEALAVPTHLEAGNRSNANALPTPIPIESASSIPDAIDLHILRLLQDDGRMSKTKIAEAVGLSCAAAHERVRRLTRQGVILGYEALLNPAKLCGGILVYAEVMLDYTGVGVAADFKAAVAVRAEILECHEVAGGFDYLIKTRVANLAAYRDLVASVVWTLPGVREVRTFPVLEEIKSTERIAI
jgi:Lrp/AsnC family leucine-responsive transcriptional regulator